MSGRLDGTVAIITGASTGLGPVMAKRFVDEGVLHQSMLERGTGVILNTITGQSVVVDTGSSMLG